MTAHLDGQGGGSVDCGCYVGQRRHGFCYIWPVNHAVMQISAVGVHIDTERFRNNLMSLPGQCMLVNACSESGMMQINKSRHPAV